MYNVPCAILGTAAVIVASSGWVYPLVTSPLNIQTLLILLVFLGLSYSVLRFMLGFFQNGDALVNAVKNRGGKRN